MDKKLKDAVHVAASIAPDRPPMRAWTHTIFQLAQPEASANLMPNSSVLGRMAADGPSIGRLLELVGWQGVGAAFDGGTTISLDLPVAPPPHLPVGERGAFAVGDRWPLPPQWSFTVEYGVVRLRGPDFAASSLLSDPSWNSSVPVVGTGINASIPLFNPSLMSRDFQEFPMVRSRRYAEAWAPTVVRAAAELSEYSRFAASCVEGFVSSIIPLVGGDESIGSASREEALGLIFLPASETLVDVAECLLHEAMHQYLFRIEECGSLFSDDADESDSYYSPWRTDSRPLRMMVHGAFVFAAVADLYLWDDAPARFGIDRRECCRRAYYRARQVEIALGTVRQHAKLARFGIVVAEAIEHDVASILGRFKVDSTDRARVEDILAMHSRQHASYTH